MVNKTYLYTKQTKEDTKMDVVKRINELMTTQELTEYQLAKFSGLADSTISNMRRRNTVPSVPTLEQICKALDISLSQFFADKNTVMYPVSDMKHWQFFDLYIQLSDIQQALICQVVREMLSKGD